jgi:hypothetical protein
VILGDLQEALIGVWEGTALPSVGSYPILVVLAPGGEGTIVGTVQYPTFPCGGTHTLVDGTDLGLTDAGPPPSGDFGDAAAASLILGGTTMTEQLTWGFSNCADGGDIVYSLRDDGRLNFTWTSGGWIESGTLSRQSTLGFDVPTGYVGAWAGSVTVPTDAGDAGLEGVTVALTLGTAGEVVGSIAYHDSTCVAKWTLDSVGASSLSITEDVTHGACATGGTVTLSLAGSSIEYTWTKSGEPSRSGTLAPL